MIPIQRLSGRLGNQMFQYAYLLSQARKGEIPDIYVQDPALFASSEDEIKRVFREGVGKPIDIVAIHVRRSSNPINPDEPSYCSNPFYVNLAETPYYEDAMAQFPSASFLVFSDDIEWCKKQPIFKSCEFSNVRDEILDLNLMASCTGHIIANSSYSWWGAFISPYTQKVIAPKRWYSDNIERTKCPETWIRI